MTNLIRSTFIIAVLCYNKKALRASQLAGKVEKDYEKELM